MIKNINIVILYQSNFQKDNSNHIGILGVLLTETMLVTAKNPGPLPSRSQVRQIRVEYGLGRI